MIRIKLDLSSALFVLFAALALPNHARAGMPLDQGTSFEGISFSGWTPAFPSIAAGPASLVVMVNQSLAIFDKTGTNLFQQNLAGSGGFWGAQGADSVRWPWVIYDPHSNRLFAIAADHGNSLGFIYLAVSKTSTPSGSGDWYKYALDRTGTFLGLPYDGDPTTSKNPKLGVDGAALYVTDLQWTKDPPFNVGDSFSHATIFAIEKAPLLGGGPLTILYDEVFAAAENPIVPAIVHDAGSPMYFTQASPTSSMRVHALTNVLTAPTRTASIIGVDSWKQPPNIPQLGGGAPLTSLGQRLMSAVARNGSLWTAHAVGHPDPTTGADEAEVRWYEFDVTNFPAGAATLKQSGVIDPDPKAAYGRGQRVLDSRVSRQTALNLHHGIDHRTMQRRAPWIGSSRSTRIRSRARFRASTGCGSRATFRWVG